MTEFAITLSKILLDHNLCTKMTGRMSSRTCYTKLNFDFPYRRSLSLRRDTYFLLFSLISNISTKHLHFMALEFGITYLQNLCICFVCQY